jgi:phosphomannomutase
MDYAGQHARDAAAPHDSVEDLLDAARDWAEDDLDDETRDELDDVIERAEQGDEEAVADLRDRFSGMLEFGTAGLRGALGAGPNRMNRSVVIRAAAGLTAYLRGLHADNGSGFMVVIGYDARKNSDVFAHDTAAVVVGGGGSAMVMPYPLPTPVLAFAIRRLGAAAGVMVTASHNPAQDNGYKVYLGDGSQIVPPVDAEIAAHIARVSRVMQVPMVDDGWGTLGEEIVEDYLDATAAVVRPDTPRDLSVVHTSLHGVGNDTLVRAFERAGFPAPHTVPSQQKPDPAFPTVSFPNPEEPGAIDAALALAREVKPDIVIANDPDADRCAVAIPADGDWRMLHGDEVGALLGSHILMRGVPQDGTLANSIVSCRLLAAMAKQHGVRHEETLTGFKWISRISGLRYGYEEALGYCVDPDTVRDKDGVSAALMIAELAAILKAEGRTLQDVLDDLERQLGVHSTDSFSVRVDDLSIIGQMMSRLRAHPPSEIGGITVSRADDLALGTDSLPPTEGLRYYLEDDSRVIVRPSGTEPKLKVYLEAIEPVADSEDLTRARATARARLDALHAAMAELTAPAAE